MLFGLQGTSGAEVTITGDREVLAMMEKIPVVANSELNSAFSVAGGIFYKAFNVRLSGAGIKVKRQVKARKKMDCTVPVKARAMGFYGRILNKKLLKGKQLRMWSGSPVMWAHEHGATIRAKAGKSLSIRVQNKAEAAKTRTPGEKVPFLLQVKQVRLKPRLGFYTTWEQVQPTIYPRLVKAAERIAARANRGFNGMQAATAGTVSGGGE